MSAMMPFTKMVGAGNDFIVIDARPGRPAGAGPDWKRLSPTLCDRHRGIGADGVLLLEPSRRADVRLRIFNADGSEAEMCGNGARCVARFLAEGPPGSRAAGRRAVKIETRAGLISAVVAGERVEMRMTDPTGWQADLQLEVEGRRLRGTFLNTGVPHVVLPVAELEAVDVARLGRAVRRHRQFAPDGTNVNFIQTDPEDADRLRVRTYERGVEAETLACGTGVTASAVAHGLGRLRPGGRSRCRIAVGTRSGDVLHVSFEAARNGREARVREVVLEGPARRVFDGVLPWPSRGARGCRWPGSRRRT